MGDSFDCVTDDDGHPYFEGPEKLLEVWFKPATSLDGSSSSVTTRGPDATKPDSRWGLRTVDRKVWEEMLDLVHCQILNSVSNDYLDSFVLSESSMFVWNTKLILKTCGTTTLLLALDRLIEIAKSVGLPEIENLFFSRRNFSQPERQLGPHKNFADEVKVLDQHCDDGSAYVLGKLNGEHWYLYMTEKPEKKEGLAPDATLEILMSDLDQEAMKPFYKQHSTDSRAASVNSGIANLFPEAQLDDFLFDPLGYSVNGILDGGYFTIHVTPQSSCSYASFETNILLPSYTELIEKVVNVFKPGRATISVFSNDPVTSIHSRMEGWDLEGYEKQEKTFYQFEVYNLSFMSQVKSDRKAAQKQLTGKPTEL